MARCGPCDPSPTWDAALRISEEELELVELEQHSVRMSSFVDGGDPAPRLAEV